MTIYIVRPRIVEAGQPIPERLIKAKRSAQAQRHVAAAFIVTPASDDDLMSAVKRGVQIEDATADDDNTADA